MKKIAVRLLAGFVLVIALGILSVWLVLRASLAQLDGQVSVSGLSAAATIERDAAGIPVIAASNRNDLAFATGFAHGQDRFFQMDLIRRQAAGELSELVGEDAINVDKRNRFHRFRTRATRLVAALSRPDRQLLQHYADGVNAGRGSLLARPFEYLVLGVDPQPWRPEDSILVVDSMYLQLNDSRATKEVRRGLARQALPAEVYAWMYPRGTSWDAPLMGEPDKTRPIPAAEILSLRGVDDDSTPSDESGRNPLPGSNNWAVSGKLTTNGRALVSNDMHLGLSVPNIYYRARFVVRGDTPIDVSGVTLPGVPFVVAGSNSKVAWGYTNSYGDYTDAVLLMPGDTKGSYKTPDGDREFDVYNEIINVKDGDSVEYEVRETVWGPVLDDVDYPEGDIAVSWIAHTPESANLEFTKLETAGSVDEALDIANTIGMPPQNFVAGDVAGNIGWTIAGKIPVKTDFDAMLPADWSTGHGWPGWLSQADYPRIINPESGRIWTANARVTDADALRVVGDGGYALGARAMQIRDALFARDTFTPDDMLSIQTDDRALFLARWRDLLLELLDDETVADDALLAEYRQLVHNWIPRAVPESVGYRLVRAFRLDVERRLFYALTTPLRDTFGENVRFRISNQFEGVMWPVVTERPLHVLPGAYENWDQFLLAVVKKNIEYFVSDFDGPLSDRTWGEANTAAIRHPLSRAIPVLGLRLDMAADQLRGDADMPLAQGPAFGASERFSVSPGDEANGLMQMPTGASGHPLSPFYRNGHSDWVDGLARPFLPGAVAHTLTLVPDKM